MDTPTQPLETLWAKLTPVRRAALVTVVMMEFSAIENANQRATAFSSEDAQAPDWLQKIETAANGDLGALRYLGIYGHMSEMAHKWASGQKTPFNVFTDTPPEPS